MELATPALTWQQDTPHSGLYGDVYYSRSGGLEEARHVFLAGNHLPERLRRASGVFTVGETGLGTGLNFLALWQAWRNIAEPRPRLHYLSAEMHPLPPEDLERAHSCWPELAALSAELRAVYPPAIAGPHRRWLAERRIQIDFLWGDAAHLFGHYRQAEGEVAVDAWFLDGFAPSRNAEMWHPALYEAIAKLSAPGATLATFTSAGAVRRGLQAAGFTVEKCPGYGRKREMSIGILASEASQMTTHPPRKPKPEQAIVIGAGIAGVMSAWRLTRQGRQVTLLEAGEDLCTGASGNPASAFTPYYPAKWNARGRILASGFHTMRHVLQYLEQRGHMIGGRRQGLLMLALPEREGEDARATRLGRWQRSLILPEEIRREVTAAAASVLAGIELTQGGWFYPQGGWLNMRDLCAALLVDAGGAITFRPRCRIGRLSHDGAEWRAHSTEGESFAAPTMVLAAAYAAKDLLPELPLHPVQGALLRFDAPEAWRSLVCPVHAGHTLIPLDDGRMVWGATFRHGGTEPLPAAGEIETLLEDLRHAFPHETGWVDSLRSGGVELWQGWRCTHPSRQPLTGPAPGHPPGLYLNLAHGARGALGAAVPFAAQNGMYERVERR